jgi:hypothetical protein
VVGEEQAEALLARLGGHARYYHSDRAEALLDQLAKQLSKKFPELEDAKKERDKAFEMVEAFRASPEAEVIRGEFAARKAALTEVANSQEKALDETRDELRKLNLALQAKLDAAINAELAEAGIKLFESKWGLQSVDFKGKEAKVAEPKTSGL